MNAFERIVHTITWRTSQIGQIALVIAMSITVANVILRIPWNPVPGTVEIVEMSGAVLLGMGVAYCAAMKGHIMVGVLVDRFPLRIQAMVDIVTNTLGLIFSYFLAREIFVFALRMMDRGYTTPNLSIPVWPAITMVAIGFVMLALVLIKDLLKSVIFVVKGSDAE